MNWKKSVGKEAWKERRGKPRFSDIEITDQFETDVSEFRASFPALREAVIQKAVLAPFDRAKAQQCDRAKAQQWREAQ